VDIEALLCISSTYLLIWGISDLFRIEELFDFLEFGEDHSARLCVAERRRGFVVDSQHLLNLMA